MAFFFTSDHVRIYYEVHGEGEKTIMFLNGGGCSYKYWYKQMPLSEKYRLVFADLRGHGNSDKPVWGYTKERMAEDAKDLIDYLDLAHVYLCGWSCGAMYALEYFNQWGAYKIDGIIYDDMSVKPMITDDGVNFSLFGNYSTTAAINYVQSLNAVDIQKPFSFVPGAATFFKYPEQCKEYLDVMDRVSPSVPAARCCINVALSTCDQRAVLPKINIPFLLVEGTMHAIYPKASYDYIEANVPNCKRVIFEGAGHALHMEYYERFNQVVDDFIQGKL